MSQTCSVRIVVEPVVPDQWVAETGYAFPNTTNGFGFWL